MTKDNEPVAWIVEENVVVREDFAAMLGWGGQFVGTGRAIPHSWHPILYTAPPDLAAKVAKLEADITQWQTSVLEQGEVIDRLKAQRDELLAILENVDALIRYQYTGSKEAMSALQQVAWEANEAIARVKGEK